MDEVVVDAGCKIEVHTFVCISCTQTGELGCDAFACERERARQRFVFVVSEGESARECPLSLSLSSTREIDRERESSF